MHYINKFSVPDGKDSQGNWLTNYVSGEEVDGVPVFCYTRGYVLWNNMAKRCIPGGAYQKSRPSYQGTTNDFDGIQDFITWCQDQHGYMSKDATGKFWQLDKDLLIMGNKSYNKNSCCFVPHYVNMLLNTRNASRGELPLGVTKVWNGSLVASYRQEYLGMFKIPQEAHKAWQRAVINRLTNVAKDDSLGEVVQSGLMKRVSIIEEHYNAGIITEYKGSD